MISSIKSKIQETETEIRNLRQQWANTIKAGGDVEALDNELDALLLSRKRSVERLAAVEAIEAEQLAQERTERIEAINTELSAIAEKMNKDLAKLEQDRIKLIDSMGAMKKQTDQASILINELARNGAEFVSVENLLVNIGSAARFDMEREFSTARRVLYSQTTKPAKEAAGLRSTASYARQTPSFS